MLPRITALLVLFNTLYCAPISWEDYKGKALLHQHEADGWCSVEKASKMMDLIYSVHPTVCVEVGVFGGSSIYPTAMALSYLNEGKVYAIDPWEHAPCQVGYDTSNPNYIWWTQVNLEQIYCNFLRLLKRHQLTSFCQPMRMTSQKAVHFFDDESIDILHIDGNHTEEVALEDAMTWLPKVKPGGYIWFDDVNWSSTAKAVAYLEEHCDIDFEHSIGNSCLLFHKL
ncbi:MAG: hypothetical protein RLZZ453_1058 [Chlamydiota bacterium]|jgi:hypothetical protein